MRADELRDDLHRGEATTGARSRSWSVTCSAGIWRYNADGTADASFNGTGFVRDTSLQSAGVGVALDSSGRIVVAGFGDNGTDWDAMVWRYDPSGTPDTSFNGSGFATHDAAAGGNGEDIAIGIGNDSAGRILLAGYGTNAAGNQDVILPRSTPLWRSIRLAEYCSMTLRACKGMKLTEIAPSLGAGSAGPEGAKPQA